MKIFLLSLPSTFDRQMKQQNRSLFKVAEIFVGNMYGNMNVDITDSTNALVVTRITSSLYRGMIFRWRTIAR